MSSDTWPCSSIACNVTADSFVIIVCYYCLILLTSGSVSDGMFLCICLVKDGKCAYCKTACQKTSVLLVHGDC